MKRNSSFKVVRIFNSTVLLAVGASLCLIGSTNLVTADCTPPASGLVSWWPGESSAVDIIGTNNGIMTNGATFAAGKVGQAFSFNGSGQFVKVPQSSTVNSFGNQITIEFWMKANLSNTMTSFQGLVATDHYGIEISNGLGGLTGLNFFVDTLNGSALISSANGGGIPVSSGIWHHVAGTYDGTKLQLYIDGQPAGAAVSASGVIVPMISTSYLSIGSDDGRTYCGCGGRYFWGLIDDPTIYNRALSSNEIAAIYNAGSAGKCAPASANCVTPPSGLISWWPGESSAIDIIGTNNGTLSASGASYTTGLAGQAFRFDGTNGYVRIPDAPALKPTNITVEAWVWLDPSLPEHRGGEQIIFKKNTWTAWFEGYSLLKATVDNGNGTYSDRFEFTVSRTGNQKVIRSTTIAQRGIWYHVAATYDGNQSKLYVNGALEATATPGFALDYDTTPIYIGTSGTWAPYLSMFGGIIDEPSIYNRALSSNEIANIYNAGSAGKCQSAEPLPLVIAGPITNQANGHIYYLLASSTWTKAEAKAVTLGGHLATINDAAEDTWVFSMFGSYGGINRNLWIGLRDTANDTTTVAANHATNFLWVSGSNAPYRNWYPGEPNNGDWTGIKEYFGFIDYFYGGKWQDSVDSAQLPGKSEGQYGVVEIEPEIVICTPPPSGLVGWWPAEGDATDSVKGNNGVLLNGASFTAGKVGQAFLFSTTNAGVKVPANPALNVGLSSGLTIEGWINPSDLSQRGQIAEWNNGNTNLTVTWGVHMQIFRPDEYGLGAGNLIANIWSSTGQQHLIMAPGGTLVTNKFQHIALTYDKTTGVARLYRNGSIVAQQYIGIFTPLTSYDFYIGRRPAGDGTVSFKGAIDELSLYNRALSTNEIQAIYSAGSAGKCFSPTAPQIVGQPMDQTAYITDNSSFNVAATGTAPLSYQWNFKGSTIPGATNSSLMLSNVNLLQAGTYSVIVSNPYGAVNSSNAMLTVLIPPCSPAPSGLVGWWPAEGDATDSVKGNNGVLLNGASFTAGKVGQAFLFSTTNAGVKVPANPALNVGLSSGLTIEGWINPSDLSQRGQIAEWNNGNTNLTVTWGVHMQIFRPDEYGLGAGNLIANIWSSTGQQHLIMAPGGTLVTNKFQHIALTYDKTTGVARLYRNGSIVAQQYIGIFTPLTSYDFYIGRRPAGDGTVSFKGAIDELSLYNRALSTNEIQAVCNARGTGKCPLPPSVLSVTPTNWYVNEGSTVSYVATATGSPTLAYQWQHNGSVIPGEANAILTLSNVVYAQAGNYTVVVSNLAGLASSNVTLRVNRAPIADASASASLLISPNDTNAIAVLDGSRSSDPDGDALNYAWFISGEAAPFATGVVTMKSLPVGTNHLILTVNDSMASGSQNFAVEVITASQAVDRLSQLVKTNSSNSMALIASLRAALLAIDRSHPAVAIQMLEVFINKVHVQLEPVDPALAAEFIAEAQAIIDALKGDGNVALKAIELLPITSGANGKSHLKIKGNANRTYVIETSTNMVDWVPAGVATRAEDGTYEFDDTQAQGAGVRFYRVVSPQ